MPRTYLCKLRTERSANSGFGIIRALANLFGVDIWQRSKSAQFAWMSPHGLCSLSPGIYSRAVGSPPGWV